MNKKKRYIILLSVLCIATSLIPYQISFAEKPTLYFDEDTGEFTFETEDTKASTNITWETIGFNVCREWTEDPTKIAHAKFDLLDGQRKEKEIPGNKYRVTFTFTDQQVDDAFEGTGLETIQDNDHIYINAVIKVHNGTKEQDVYETLEGIKNAEAWYNKEDFDDRFNLDTEFNTKSTPYPVSIEYQLYRSSGNPIIYDKKEYEERQNRTIFKTGYNGGVDKNGRKIGDIPGKIEYNGETHFLYRVYYINLGDPYLRKQGNRKTAINPYVDYNGWVSELSYVRHREFLVKTGGLKVVAMYRRMPKIEDDEKEDKKTKQYEIVDPTAVIAADNRDNEQYDVIDGIPGTESVYVNAFTSKYIAGSTFIRKYGKKTYNVSVKKTYTLTWTETDPKTKKPIPKKSVRTVTYQYPVEREYSYWIISKLGVYGINNAVIENAALPGGGVTLTPNGYSPPTVSYNHREGESDHIVEPKIKVVVVPPQTISGGSVEPSIPSENFKSSAEKSVAKIKCKNDSLIFNGETIMSSSFKEEKTEEPKEIPSGLEIVGENVLYKANIEIPGTRANGDYDSMAILTYKPIVELNPDEVETTYEVDYVNNVVVHTPTVCDAQIENKYRDNQMINPDKSRVALVLDRPFYVTLPTTGTHRYIKGYQYRDYGKYIADREVKFPFDVYRGSSTNGTFIPKDTWESIGSNVQFYLPTWVNEGKYTIQFRSTAINAYANSGTGRTETLANLKLSNYVATDTVNVEVSGRIYGLYLYDISDYPVWKDIFRKTDSLALTGFKYKVGIKDQNGESNGQNSNHTLTLVNGSHPKYKNIGVLKTGYVSRFSLHTVGNMYSENDYIKIKPTFYYVDSKGKNRQEVDIYYSETFNGKHNVMVKMGSSLDLKNKKSFYTNDRYISIPETALKQTASLEGMSLKSWKGQKKNVFTFTNIMIPRSLRTLIGFLAKVPSTVTVEMVAKSVQNWYGEYYIPSEVHVVPKGFDVLEYIKKNGPINYKENIWLSNGYIIVNFDVETIQNGKRHLSYINSDNAPNGYCNMWKREGYQYQKTDYKGNTFHFIDGDYIMYYTEKSAAKDYISSGTH